VRRFACVVVLFCVCDFVCGFVCVVLCVWFLGVVLSAVLFVWFYVSGFMCVVSYVVLCVWFCVCARHLKININPLPAKRRRSARIAALREGTKNTEGHSKNVSVSEGLPHVNSLNETAEERRKLFWVCGLCVVLCVWFCGYGFVFVVLWSFCACGFVCLVLCELF